MKMKIYNLKVDKEKKEKEKDKNKWSYNITEKKRTINNNYIKYPHNTIQSPITKTKIHKRINSLGNNSKDNNKNIKPMNNHYKKNSLKKEK